MLEILYAVLEIILPVAILGFFFWRVHKMTQEMLKEFLNILLTIAGVSWGSHYYETVIVEKTYEVAPQNVIVLNSRDFSPSYLFEKGTQFSLVYASQGSLSTKTGICPEGSNEEWLKLFKKSITECSKEEQVKLKIRGFASIAPVNVKEQSKPDSAQSDTLNYQIANQRAEALIYFLTLPESIPYAPEKCEAALDSSSIWGRNNELGPRVMPDTARWNTLGFNVINELETRRRLTFAMSDANPVKQRGKGFDVIYEPWQSYGEMKKNKPVNDGSRPKPRHYPLEFLNRTVQIIIEEGGCLTKDAAGKSD